MFYHHCNDAAILPFTPDTGSFILHTLSDRPQDGMDAENPVIIDAGDAGPDEGPACSTSDAVEAPTEAPAGAAAPPGTESATAAAGHVAMATVRARILSRLCLGVLRVLAPSKQSRIYHSSQNRTATWDQVKARLARPLGVEV